VIGTTLGHYRITSALGAGGMGAVYRAIDTRLGREVALKVLPVDVSSSRHRLERFQREARTVAALNHPHIVTIHSIEEAGGIHFLTMELVEGQSLDRVIPSSGFPIERILEIGVAVAAAVAAAHEKGIVHRDLKPANVMVASDGRIKVLDFGLAKVAHPAAEDVAAPTELHTRDGVVMGTVPYMAPEQLANRVVDHRADIFALGTLLFEMSTGRRPFEARSEMELASAILRDTPLAITVLRPDLPAGLARIIRRCLEKEPRERIQTARDLADELRAVSKPPTSDSCERIGGAAVAIAVLPFADMSAARDQEHLCEGMAEEIMNALVHVDGIRVASRTSAFRARAERDDLLAIGRALSVGYVLEGSVRTSGSRLRVTAQLTDLGAGYQLWSERFDRELQDVFAVQDDIAAGVVEAVRVRLAARSVVAPQVVSQRSQVKNLEAYRHYLKGRHLRYTKNDHGAALRAFQQAIELDPTHAPSLVGIAEVTTLSSFYSLIPARNAYATAKEALAVAAREQGESAEARYVEGMIAFGEQHWSQAEQSFLRALELDPGNVRALCWRAATLAVLGRIDHALPVLDHAREIDPLSPYPYAMTGICLLAAGRAAASERYFDQALAFDGENSLALWPHGVALVALGRAEEGVAMIERTDTPAQRPGLIHAVLGWALAGPTGLRKRNVFSTSCAPVPCRRRRLSRRVGSLPRWVIETAHSRSSIER